MLSGHPKRSLRVKTTVVVNVVDHFSKGITITALNRMSTEISMISMTETLESVHSKALENGIAIGRCVFSNVRFVFKQVHVRPQSLSCGLLTCMRNKSDFQVL